MPDVSGNPRVLVVDDERVIADTLALILDRNGFTTRVAYSGEEAITIAEEYPLNVLITDMLMPGVNGIQTAVEVRRRATACRVLLMSGQSVTDALLKEANALGQDFEILIKPVHPRALLERLNSGV